MRRSTDKTRQLVFLLFGLAAVILIFLQLRRTQPQPPPELAKLPKEQRIAIVDSTYINLPFLFSIRMPNRQRQLSLVRTDTVLSPFVPSQPIGPQLLTVARATRLDGMDTVAVTTFSLLARPKDKEMRDLGIEYLAEHLETYDTFARTEVMQQVSEPAHSVLKGSYFALLLPNAANRFRVRIVALLPRQGMIYVVQSKTTENAYSHLHQELEHMVRNFKPIPSVFVYD